MTANAYNQSAKDLYFDNSEAKWNSCYVYIGHGTWTSVYAMSRVSGTQYLWKLPANFNGGNSWDGATGWVVCYEKWWDSKDESIDKYTWHGDKNVTQKSTSAWVDTKIYKTNGTASTKSDNHTINAYKVTSYTKNNYTVTINTVEGGTLTVNDYDNNAVATGASKIHLTVLKFSATPASGYVLDAVEISDGTNTTTIAAADLATTTHTLTSAVTITPVWRATTSTVTVTATATNGTVTGGGVVEEGTSVTLTATPADGYKFVNWTVGGAEVSTANPYTFTAEADVTVTANFEELPKETVYFVNNKEWSTVNAYAWNKPNDTNNGWPGVAATKTEEKVAGFDVYSFTAIEGQYTNVIFNTDGSQTEDLVWTAGKYYWMGADKDFAGATKEEVESTLATPIPDVWTIVGAETLMGVHWDLNASANNMQLQQDGSYILTRDDISLAKGDYEYKAVKDHSYNVAIPQDGNQKLTIETAGIYDITFTLKDSKLTTVATLVKAEVIIPTVFVAGKNLNKWSTTANELILSKDSLTASATIALKEGTDSIKMVVGGNWLGNNGTMTRENDGQAWTFKADDGNCAIVADIAGNYVFTWNFDKNQLTVTYPELPTPTYDVTTTATVSTQGQNIVLSGSWEEKALTVMLWQGGATQGFGTYAAEDYAPIFLGAAELTPTSEGVYADNSDGTFTFTATATDSEGAIYNITLTGDNPVVEPEYKEWEGSVLFTEEEGTLSISYAASDWSWSLKLYIENYTGHSTYEVANVYYGDETVEYYDMYGTVTVEYADWAGTDVLYADLTSGDGTLKVWATLYNEEPVAAEYDVVITNATVTENTSGYYIDMTGEWDGHTIKVEVCDELTADNILANFFIDGGIINGGNQAEGTVEATVSGGIVTITGTFECMGTGDVYHVTISGTLPDNLTTAVDNLNATVAPVKMINNGQLVIIKNGVQYNAQGAVVK